ncbi:MAG: isopenicillin N synthase family oxygenase [Alphaproteobacteria bacterium]|nr:isopenicillin N synthase family oxygenase [Alphaproteobacteria bacterium]
MTIPIIDIAGLRRHDAAATEAAATAIREACTARGFFYVAGHGVPAAIIDAAAEQARHFFHLPLEVKRRAAVNARHRGFNALGDALMYEAKHPDQKEFFSIGLELPEDDPDVLAGEKLRGPNNWPAEMPAFRAALSAYYDALGACGADLMRGVAVSLGVAPDFFADRYRKRLQRTQIIYYPPQPPMAEADVFGVAPHTDFGCITLLWQDDNGGLEVLDRASRAWIPATPIPGTLVVNAGDLLGRWTNDRYASTPHRVVNRSGRERFSIATFYDPDFKAVVDPRALGVAEADCRYPPVSAGEHILGRIERSFGYRKRLAATA